MSRPSLDAGYFDGIFAGDDDPWGLAASPYEAAKFDATVAALGGRRFARALEIGCAHGVLTAQLLPWCDRLLAIDISRHALARAAARLGERPGLSLARMAFPAEAPAERGFDLVVASEVVYYWSDADIARAGHRLAAALAPGGSLLLVHWTGETDYPQTGDDAVAKLRAALGDAVTADRETRTADYRLDLWRRA